MLETIKKRTDMNDEKKQRLIENVYHIRNSDEKGGLMTRKTALYGEPRSAKHC